MSRVTTLLVLGAFGVALTPATGSAQFGLPRGAPVIVPSTNPFFYVPKHRYTQSFRITGPTLFGQTSIGFTRSYQSVNPIAPWALTPAYPAWYSQTGSYMTGRPHVRDDVLRAAQRDLMRAQNAATYSAGVKDQIADLWVYEKGVAPAPGGLLDGKDGVELDALRKALAATEPEQVATGEPLNKILAAVAAAEAKGAKGPSAFVSPTLLSDVRFAGSPEADAINLLRRGGRLDFPSAFDDPVLLPVREALERDFGAVAAAVLTGKPPERAKVAKLGETVQRAQDALTPVIKNVPFEDATAARRFVNQLSAAVKVFNGPAAEKLIQPKWSAEGTTAADLVRYMTRHKLTFGPVAPGSEESYLTMHRNLATYLFVLSQPKK